MNQKSKRFVRNLTVLLVVLFGTLLALPTFFPVDPVLQVSNEDGSPLDASDIAAIDAVLRAQTAPSPGKAAPELESAKLEVERGVARLRFASIDAQIRAKGELDAALPGYVVAFDLRPRLPRWIERLGLKPVTLGLDLRGGVHFVYEVDLDVVTHQVLESELGGVREALREDGVRAESRISDNAIEVELRDSADADTAREAIRRAADPGAVGWRMTERRAAGRQLFVVTPADTLLEAKRRASMEQNITTLRNRVNQLGVSEVVVQSQGANRILVEVPGVQDPAQLERILGSTATLEWRLDDMQHDPVAASRHAAPPGTLLRYDRRGMPLLLQREVIASGEQLTDATFGYSEGRPTVLVRLDAAGAKRMREATLHNVGKLLAVVYAEERRVPLEARTSELPSPAIESPDIVSESPRPASESPSAASESSGAATESSSTSAESSDAATELSSTAAESSGPAAGSEGAPRYRLEREETVIFNGRIDSVLSDRFELRGLPSVEAQDLAVLLRAGALAAPLYKVEGGTVSPTLGQDNIAKGRLAMIAGLVAVVVFMAAYYRVFGLIADLAVLANLVLVVAAMSLIHSSLTLPGMAGLVLTAGMAVDANVLIFERIREELRKGRSPLVSIEEGYAKAWATIVDSNLTTLIAGAVLFVFGTGPIKGFAVTLSLGILTSMYTAVVGTRALVDVVYGRAPKRLHIGGYVENKALEP
jgi:preprotein translocase subunit SecD